jgi:hypothetical protein
MHYILLFPGEYQEGHEPDNVGTYRWYGTLITEKGYQTLSLLLHRALGGLPSGDTVSWR